MVGAAVHLRTQAHFHADMPTLTPARLLNARAQAMPKPRVNTPRPRACTGQLIAHFTCVWHWLGHWMRAPGGRGGGAAAVVVVVAIILVVMVELLSLVVMAVSVVVLVLGCWVVGGGCWWWWRGWWR